MKTECDYMLEGTLTAVQYRMRGHTITVTQPGNHGVLTAPTHELVIPKELVHVLSQFEGRSVVVAVKEQPRSLRALRVIVVGQ